MTAAKMIARVSERQSPMVSPHTHGLPVEISQMANAAIAASSISASVNSYQRGDCAGWAAPLAAACCRLRRAHQQPDQERQDADDGDDEHRLDEIVALCSKDGLTFRSIGCKPRAKVRCA